MKNDPGQAGMTNQYTKAFILLFPQAKRACLSGRQVGNHSLAVLSPWFTEAL